MSNLSDNEMMRLFRIRQTVMKMLQNRGYVVNRNEMDMSFAQWKVWAEKYSSKGGHHHDHDHHDHHHRSLSSSIIIIIDHYHHHYPVIIIIIIDHHHHHHLHHHHHDYNHHRSPVITIITHFPLSPVRRTC